MSVKISVVIPCLNAVKFIESSIQSVLGQGYPNFELIVADGASKDGTLEVARKYGPNLTLLSEKDSCKTDAINKGLKLAGGDIVTYLCADDVYEPGCFQRVADFFEKNPGVKWAYGKCRIIDDRGREIRKSITRYKEFWQRRYSYNSLLVTDFIAQPAVFWRKELADEIGLFDVKALLVMDYEYWLRAGARYKPGFIDAYLSSFRQHTQSECSVDYSGAARELLGFSKRYARSQERGFLIPLQYLNYLSVILGYSVLNLISPLGSKSGESVTRERIERLRGKGNGD